jgi:hypothetical protein
MVILGEEGNVVLLLEGLVRMVISWLLVSRREFKMYVPTCPEAW